MKDIDLLVQYALKNEEKAPQELNDDFIKEFSERRVSRAMKPKFPAAAVAVPLMLAIAGTGAYAVSKSGYFRDKTTMFGTVTGSVYENADNEINVSLGYEPETITVKVVFSDPDSLPYRDFETIDLNEFGITDQTDGSAVSCGEIIPAMIKNGEAEIRIPVGKLKSGSYAIAVSSFLGGKKADQPLEVKGHWTAAIDVQ
ncbi:hypothetical protein [Ruminococcus sp.]|uniref:hypothetical protein n=1 Tax=Ruminococcus sp. TaxID=41978 RepID=UPI0025EEF6B9|nr:hypothetical protein [Ruminococcus sp.]